jgi:molecular chaperone IbpA|tara:strand:- start:2001 stop:2438 length:438 start_codon:yes stop_codon:yes gene_type:complete
MVTGNTLSLFNENFNKLTPYAVGFDHIFDNLNRYVDNQQAQGFPPYNIRKEGDYHYVIEMALAGFGKEDIQVEIAENTLSVRSIKENSEDEDTQYRGISFRRFERKFTLADDLVVNNANLENGMLYIDIERIIPEEKKPRLIEVK